MPPSELYQNLLRVFEASGWNYTEVSGKEVIRAGFEAHHTRVELHVQIFAPLTAISVVAEARASRGSRLPDQSIADGGKFRT